MTGRRMTGAELAAHRHLIGLTGEELADALGVRPRTILEWEGGREPIPYRVPDEIADLVVEHSALVARILGDGRPLAIVRDKSVATPRPRGWHVAAAARALTVEPDLMVEWA